MTNQRATSSSAFLRLLRERNPRGGKRQWLFVPYDQLTGETGPLQSEKPQELGIVLVENRWKAARRPYHKQKLAHVLSNMRHFALEQAERGVAVRFCYGDAPYAELLRTVIKELGPLRMMRPAERELRADLASLIRSGGLIELPNTTWLTTPEQFRASQTGPPWRMDSFYRHVRRETELLMEKGKPAGGQFSFDPENRLAWPGHPPAPVPPVFPPDEVTAEVCQLVEREFAHHPRQLCPENLVTTQADAEKLWSWAQRECLPMFGPFEDAMSRKSRGLFHTRLSALLNLSRLLPARVVREAAGLPLPLPSKEGFIRQVLGWREFMRHVHEETDGFRSVRRIKVAANPGDGGFTRWSGAAWPAASKGSSIDGGACPSTLDAQEPLPGAFWGTRSGLACLDTVVREVWEDAYGHHITRLMVLSNIATLLDIAPRELTDWFWVAYADAYDWVVEPNVLGMGTYALGPLFTTKPYVSGAAYIHKMSDYCEACVFDPKKNCPLTPMYWAFLERHRERLATNARLALPYRSLAKRPRLQKETDRALFQQVQIALRDGKSVSPEAPVVRKPADSQGTPSAKRKRRG